MESDIYPRRPVSRKHIPVVEVGHEGDCTYVGQSATRRRVGARHRHLPRAPHSSRRDRARPPPSMRTTGICRRLSSSARP